MKMARIVGMVLCLCLLFGLCACGSVSQEDLNVPTFEDDQSIVLGVWSGSMVEWTEQQFTYLQEANINYLLGVSEFMGYSDAFFDRAQAAGVSVIPDNRSWNGEASDYMDHPAFVGYCVWDEPYNDDFPALTEKKALWDNKMEDKLFFVNMFPGEIGDNQFGGYDNYISSYIEAVKPEVLSFDIYPLMSDFSGKTVIKDNFFNNLDVCSYYAKQAGIPLWFSLLAAKHMSYVAPNTEEFRWQMAVGQAYGVRGLVHYAYASHDPDYYNPIDWKTQEPTELYYNMKDANAEVAAWDHIYMNYQWQGTATVTGTVNPYSTTAMMFCTHSVDPTENSGIKAISSEEDLLCGIFQDENGNPAYMLTNATNPADDRDTTVKLTLDGKYKGVLVIDRGVQSVKMLEKNAATIEVGSSEGVFVIPLTAK
ncbi:MAG: hypothetical protein J6C41_06575 [Oscillospiraceae bacterium]|nr:hypothetical protein [Oscillospiraceae bacterium]